MYRPTRDPSIAGLQTLALALGAVPLYAIARRRLGTPWSALAFPCAYLMSPALQATNLFEFHAVAFAPAFLLAAFYFMDRVTWPAETGAPPRKGLTGRWVLYGVFVLLALSCKGTSHSSSFLRATWLCASCTGRRNPDQHRGGSGSAPRSTPSFRTSARADHHFSRSTLVWATTPRPSRGTC